MKKISIIIPAYNESAFIGRLLEIVLSVNTEKLGFIKEIIVVDDGSKDNTFEVAASYSDVNVYRKTNGGKGSAVKYGIAKSTGEYVLIQDADLEYDPNDYISLLTPISKLSDDDLTKISVYGSRVLHYLNGRSRFNLTYKPNYQKFGPWFANKLLSIICLVIFRKWITDLLTGYKVYEGNFIRNLEIKTTGFETDHEITAKLINNNFTILEVPVSYNPRSVEDGKKIKAIDGLIAVCTLIRFWRAKK